FTLSATSPLISGTDVAAGMSPAFRLLTHSFEPRSSPTTWHARSLEHRPLLPAFFHYPSVTGRFAAHLEVVIRIKRNFADRVFGRAFVTIVSRHHTHGKWPVRHEQDA